MRVLVTRPKTQSADLIERLESHGAVALLLPAMEIVGLEDNSLLLVALADLNTFDWIIFTSVNGVTAVHQLVKSIPESVRIAAVGPSTGLAVDEAFRKPDAMPDEFIADAIGAVLGNVAGKRILLARADIARKEIVKELTDKGAEVHDVAAYRIVRSTSGSLEGKPDVITATSSSSVLNTLQNLTDMGHKDWALETPWICIGPMTADTARSHGCKVAQMASEYTAEGLVTALVAFAKGVAV
jgi:uroporphyrinogen-III synthase